MVCLASAKMDVLHYPTLKTVLAVEETIKDGQNAMSRNKILEKLNYKVMRSTLNVALEYLERRGVILETKKGFIWTLPSRKLLKAERFALEV